MTGSVRPQVPLLMTPPPPPFPPPPLSAARHSPEDGTSGSGLGSPTCEYMSPGKTGLDHGCQEWVPLASPLRSLEGWFGGAADSRSWACHTVSTEPEPSLPTPKPSCFQISLIALVASLK